MIARLHICLRCRSRLANRLSIASSRFASTQGRTRILFEDARAAKQPRHEPGDGPGDETSAPKMKWSIKSRNVEGNVSRHPLGKLYGHRGVLQREEQERLANIDTLGDPAQVIVLRESNFKILRPELNYLAAVEPESIDIQATLDSERGLVGEKEVEDNINQFRPSKGNHPQNWEELYQLVKELTSGFTVTQLLRYIEAHGRGHRPAVVRQEPTNSPIVRISSWVPDSLDDELETEATHTSSQQIASYTSKQVLALRLIRECWNVENPTTQNENDNELGFVQIELRESDYDLLLREQNSVFNRIVKSVLTEPGERIDGFKSISTIKITTTEARSHMIVKELELELSRLRRIMLPLNHLVPPSITNGYEKKNWVISSFDKATMERLGKLTNTSIKRIGNKALISYIENNPDSPTATKSDVVSRLLLMSTGLTESRTTRQLGSQKSENQGRNTFVPFPLTYSAPWNVRDRGWTRWATPIKKWKESPGKTHDDDIDTADKGTEIDISGVDHEPPDTDLLEKTDGLKNEALNSEVNDGPLRWSTDYSIDSSALLGNVLHSVVQKSLLVTDAPIPAGPNEIETIFHCGVIPGLRTILDSKILKTNNKPRTAVVMRFVPNPLHVPKHPPHHVSTAFPKIEMHFTVEPSTNDLVLDSMQSIVSTNYTDVMLPDSTLDLRFEQHVKSRLRGKSEGSDFPPAVLKFLQDSKLNLTKSLASPAKVMIPITSHLCRGDGLELLGSKPEDNSEMQDVEYLFAGVEVCKTMPLQFDDWLANYTSVQSGLANGRRFELRLKPLPLRSRRTDINMPYTEDDFVKSALRLVHDLNPGKASVTRPTVYKPKLVKWRHSTSQSGPGKQSLEYFTSMPEELRRS